MVVVIELCSGDLETSEALDEHLFVRVDQDVRNVRVVQEGLNRPESESFVENLFFERGTLGLTEGGIFFGNEAGDDLAHLRSKLLGADVLERREVDALDHRAMHLGLEAVVSLLERLAHARGRRRAGAIAVGLAISVDGRGGAPRRNGALALVTARLGAGRRAAGAAAEAIAKRHRWLLHSPGHWVGAVITASDSTSDSASVTNVSTYSWKLLAILLRGAPTMNGTPASIE